MKIGPKLTERLISPFRRRGRGKNGIELVIFAGLSAPSFHSSPGWTEWINGRAKRYHRASYEVRVGADWIRGEYAPAVARAALLGGEVELAWYDTYQPLAGVWWQRCQSIDEWEDERLFA